jgi:hypothetical protein
VWHGKRPLTRRDLELSVVDPTVAVRVGLLEDALRLHGVVLCRVQQLAVAGAVDLGDQRAQFAERDGSVLVLGAFEG